MAEGGDPGQDMLEGCLDCGTGVWYIINVYDGRKQTRYRADSEVSQVLEDAYKKRKKYAVYQDKDIKSTIKANLETNFLYVEGMQFPHAYIERVVAKRKEPLKENKEPMSIVVDVRQSRQIKDDAETVTERKPVSWCVKNKTGEGLSRLSEEISQILETAYHKGNGSVSFICEKTGSKYTAFFMNNFKLYVDTNPSVELVREGVDSHVDIAIVTGTLLEQKVDVIVNLTTKELNLADGYLTKIILDAAGSTIQDECRNNYRDGIKIGDIAVTSAGKLKFRKIFHGALCLPDVNVSHLLSLRSLMKNCLKKAQEERCQSIAFPALGIGRLKYPVNFVAKEMFRAVTTYATRYGVKTVKFVVPEKDTVCLRAFKDFENTRNKLLLDSQDGNPGYEASLNDCNIKIAVADCKKVTMCDVVIVLGNPAKGAPVESISLKSHKYSPPPAMFDWFELLVNSNVQKYLQLFVHH